MFAAKKNFPRNTPSLAVGRRSASRQAAGSPCTLDRQALSARIGQGFQLVEPELSAAGALLAGSLSIAQLRAGLFLHCTDVTHLHDMTTRFAMVEEGTKVLLKLEGNARVSLGGVPVGLDAGQGADACPQGAVVTLSIPEDFERHCRADTRERMVVITLTTQWFESAGLAPCHLREHLAVRAWQPSPRAIAIAEQLVRPAAFVGPMHALYQESRALDLVAEALTQVGPGEQTAPPALAPAAYRRICRLQALLDSGEADSLSLGSIAQEIGCNANTLQRQFRDTFGKTIFDYLRESRLQRAAEALERDGVSVAVAAEIAGYNSQANFSTAFRRHFGIAPKHARVKV